MARSRFDVYLTADAEADLEDITDFIEVRDSLEHADLVFSRIRSSVLALELSPKRRRVVPELREIGVTEYREAICKPYRIVFHLAERRVYVVAIIDGRRDFEELLSRRLLR